VAEIVFKTSKLASFEVSKKLTLYIQIFVIFYI